MMMFILFFVIVAAILFAKMLTKKWFWRGVAALLVVSYVYSHSDGSDRALGFACVIGLLIFTPTARLRAWTKKLDATTNRTERVTLGDDHPVAILSAKFWAKLFDRLRVKWAPPVPSVAEGKKDKAMNNIGLRVAIIGGILGLVVLALIGLSGHSKNSTPAQVVKGSDYNEPARDGAASITSPLDKISDNAPTPDNVLDVGADALLAAYQDNETDAQSKYKDRRVRVTGTLTGVFVPPPQRILQMAEKGLTATAFVTMGGGRITSPAESLLYPGIVAYSEEGAFFGQQGSIPLNVGQTVTLACKCDSGSPAMTKVAGTGPTYSVLLSGCTLEAPSPSELQTNQEPRFKGEAPLPLSNIVEDEQHSGVTTNILNTSARAVVQTVESQPPARQPSSAEAVLSSQPALLTTQAAVPTPQAVPNPKATAAPAPLPQLPPPPLVVPAGTTLVVRMNNSLTSKTANVGDSFTGTLAHSVAVNGVVAIPSGAGVSGTVSDVKSPGKFKGESILSITLNSINVRGVPMTIATSTYSQTIKGKGMRSALAIGGGAGAGALIGGLAGGGKGAGIGALVGVGAGTAGAAFTGNNKELEIPAESVLTFKLAESITVNRSSSAE